MEMTTDVAVVSRARSGDADAFRQLVERHSKPMFRVAYRMTGNEHDADDVVQETFLRAYRQLRNVEHRANFGTWLHRIAVNCSLDLLRARGRADTHYGGDPESAELTGAAAARTDAQQDRLDLGRPAEARRRGHGKSEQQRADGLRPPPFRRNAGRRDRKNTGHSGQCRKTHDLSRRPQIA
jgi:RNA polymerase sigma factor (sigma-70 family)